MQFFRMNISYQILLNYCPEHDSGITVLSTRRFQNDDDNDNDDFKQWDTKFIIF